MPEEPSYIPVSMKNGGNINQRLKMLSVIKGVTVGELVREAVDDKWGQEFEKIFKQLSTELDTDSTKNAHES